MRSPKHRAWRGCGSSLVACGVVVSLVVASTAWAAPDGGEPAEVADGDADIGELWQLAQARIDTADYGEAIELLTRLYDAIALDPDAATLRLRVQWALHRAHLGAHGVDGDLEHLYVARDLLAKYRDALPEGETDRNAEATAALDDVQRRIEEQEAADAAAADAAAADAAEAEAAAAEAAAAEAAAADAAAAEREAEPISDSAAPVDRTYRGLLIGGAVGTGLGLAGLAVMAGGLGSANAAIGRFETEPNERAAARDDIRRGNTIAIAGAAAGGVLVVGGAVLLGLGLRRRASTKGSLAAGPGQLGLGWRVQF